MIKQGLEKLITKTSENIARNSVNSACVWVLYQPVISEKMMQKLKKTEQ